MFLFYLYVDELLSLVTVCNNKGSVNCGEGDEKELSQFMLLTANYLPNNNNCSDNETTVVFEKTM